MPPGRGWFRAWLNEAGFRVIIVVLVFDDVPSVHAFNDNVRCVLCVSQGLIGTRW